MKIAGRLLRITFFLVALVSGQAHSASITNQDVIKLLQAGMSDDVVLAAISGGEPKFDVSSGALIKLKESGASSAVLKAVLATKAKPAAPGNASHAPDPKTSSGALNPEEVQVVIDGSESALQYIIPGTRTAARALGFGGVATYAALQGSTAQRRLPSTGVEFIISVPQNAQLSNYLTLASFVVRDNQTREVLTGGGYLSYSSGIHRDRVIPVVSEQLADQSRAKEGFVLYRVRPENALAPGEYALVLYTGQIRTAGFFAQVGNSFFDFGVN